MSNLASGGKGISQGAFQGSKLICPYCSGTRWKFVEDIGIHRKRYRCKDCHKTVQYDYSANMGHPYEVFGKGVWRQVTEALKNKVSPKEILRKLRRPS
jgi:transposase-like protein